MVLSDPWLLLLGRGLMPTFVSMMEQLRWCEGFLFCFFFSFVWRWAYYWFWWKILFENQCGILPSHKVIHASSPASKGEGDLQSSRCVALLWWIPYTGFKLFHLGCWDGAQPTVTRIWPSFNCVQQNPSPGVLLWSLSLSVEAFSWFPWDRVPKVHRAAQVSALRGTDGLEALRVENKAVLCLWKPSWWLWDLAERWLLLSQYICIQLFCGSYLLTLGSRFLFMNAFKPKLPGSSHGNVLGNSSLSGCLLLWRYHSYNVYFHKLSVLVFFILLLLINAGETADFHSTKTPRSQM